jgi:nicotinamide mononucleotide (NMN) deamidase PncC
MIFKEAVVAYSRYFSGMCLGVLGKTMKILKRAAVSAEIVTEHYRNASPTQTAR